MLKDGSQGGALRRLRLGERPNEVFHAVAQHWFVRKLDASKHLPKQLHVGLAIKRKFANQHHIQNDTECPTARSLRKQENLRATRGSPINFITKVTLIFHQFRCIILCRAASASNLRPHIQNRQCNEPIRQFGLLVKSTAGTKIAYFHNELFVKKDIVLCERDCQKSKNAV